MRTWFVGFLSAIGVGLYLYKGFSNIENIALNTAGVLLACVALFPERLQANDSRLDALFKACPGLKDLALTQEHELPIHFMAAALMFFCLAFVAIRCADKTLEYLPDDKKTLEPHFRRTYKTIGWLMVAFPVVGFLANTLLSNPSTLTFFVEAAGIWTFAAYWLVKSKEMSLSDGEVRVAQKKAAAGETHA